MWRSRKDLAEAGGSDPARLTLRELMATQPRHVRGRLMPGERFPTGMRPGRRRAQGSDIESIGPYVPGDDVRWMDWRATARTGRAQMKRFVAESHLARMLVIDLGPQMMFGTGPRPMAKTAALLAAHLAWEAFALQEPVGLVIVPSGVTLRPRRGRGQVLNMLRHLEDGYAAAATAHGPDAGPEMTDAIDTASALLGAGDEICVLSDFGDLPDRLGRKVRELNAIRKFRAVIIEDGMYHRPVAQGRLPYHTRGDPQRSMASVPAVTPDDHALAVAGLRRDLRRALIQDGWRVTEASGGGSLTQGAAR